MAITVATSNKLGDGHPADWPCVVPSVYLYTAWAPIEERHKEGIYSGKLGVLWVSVDGLNKILDTCAKWIMEFVN